MYSLKIIEALGGRKKVIADTGLTRGRISQWIVRNDIPILWIRYFRAMHPKLDWKALLVDAPQDKRLK